MQQHELHPPRGAKKQRKRLGRGNASGHGTYSGKGIKGQQSRSGYKVRSAFEGGQTPLVRRLPRRRGFTNPFRIKYIPVNLKQLAPFAAGSEVTIETLRDAGIIRNIRHPVKVLGVGDVSAALTVRINRVSATARAKIEGAGGTVEVLTPDRAPHPKRRRGRKKEAKASTQEQDSAAGKNGAAEDKTDSEEGPAQASAESKDD
ncbi:MAG: 50S ribosomal protein L15 [Chloroflexi bacterium]|nr:50S ribosomal protein L15 [Chloroflexota bacterium]MCI0849353.1 50S ribosomal protein L15 [Chloroflexota bacterium]